MTTDRLTVDAVIATSTVALLAYGAALAMRRRGGALRHSVARLALLAFWLAPVGALAVDAFHGGFCPVPVSASRVAVSQGAARRTGDDLSARSAWAGRDRSARTRLRAKPTSDSARRRPSPLTLLTGVWAAGLVVSLVWFGAHLRTVARVRRAAAAIDDAGLADRIAGSCQRVGLAAPPAVARSGALAVPAIAGCRRPVLLLPETFSAEDPSCDAVLVHELAHIRRGDLWAQWLARLTRAVWWWHPLAWLIAREVQVSAEEACDDWAVALTGQRRRYADYLVRWAEAARAGGALAYTCGGRALVARVRRVLAQTRVPDLTPSRRARALAMLCALAATGAGATLRAQPPAPRSEHPMGEATTMADGGEAFRYGFRVDPMEFVSKDRSLQGALVRSFVFQRPAEGDAGLIRQRIEEMLRDQRDDGTFGDTSKETGERLLRLLEMGFPPDRPEVGRGVEALLRQKRAGKNANEWVEKEGALSIYALHALCLLGRSDVPEVQFSLKWYLDHPEEWNAADKGCPWTPEVFWSALWAGREIVDTRAAINDGLRRVTEGMNAAGCNSYNDPYGFLEAAGQIDGPAARALVEKQVPMIVRGQRPDGGWGDHSLAVFRALKKHELLEALRARPPLPADWRIVRSIRAPEGDLSSLAWGGGRLWVYDGKSNSAVAVSPEDGKVLKTVKLPVENVRAIGWWDGRLAVTQRKPKMLLQVDPEDGKVEREIVVDKGDRTWVGSGTQVNGRIWVVDEFSPGVIVIDPANPDKRDWRILAGPGPECLAPEDDGVWHWDFWGGMIIKTGWDGALLDWGDQVFARGVTGLAHDGEHLWALDAANHRICVIERTGVPTE
jgi:beta-lactamase regulating signal transducer with metallopeptidase domain